MARRLGGSALRETLQRAVASQMMSDVPVGAFLSGGIDSSTVVALMAGAGRATGRDVRTFSMGFADGSYNELPYAREIAARFETKHAEGTVTPNLLDLFEKLVIHIDEPFADVSLFPTYHSTPPTSFCGGFSFYRESFPVFQRHNSGGAFCQVQKPST